MNNFMFAGSARVVTAPGLNAEPSRNKWELLRSHITRLLRGVASSACVFLPLIVGASGSRDYDSTLVRAKGKGQVTIVYQDDAVQPENRDAIKSIRDSGVFERMADRLTKAVALPHDLQVVVTDNVPKGIDDPTTEVDGRRIFWPAAFSKATLDVLTEFLPEVIASKGAPRAISQENFTADVLNVWGNQFILGHEFGHALIHQLNLPLTGLEEDSADGFATFFTVNDKDTGPNAALGAAVLFGAMGSKRPNLTLEDFSSIFEVEANRETGTYYGDRIFGSLAVQLRTSTWMPALLALGFATRFIHYLLDRSVYRMSDPQVRAAASGLIGNVARRSRRKNVSSFALVLVLAFVSVCSLHAQIGTPAAGQQPPKAIDTPRPVYQPELAKQGLAGKGIVW